MRCPLGAATTLALMGCASLFSEGRAHDGNDISLAGWRALEDGRTAEAVRAFETRLAVAEKAGLVRSGWARLPAVARSYRDRADAESNTTPKVMVSERDARTTGQVLHVLMRDLNPGR